MSIYLICLTTNGGLPILTRKKGNCENLPFSTIASLNGLHMFFKSLGVALYTTYANNWTYVWHDFFNAITVIICSCGISRYTAELLPELIFGAFSLFISRDEMSHPSLLERLKKESKNYLRLIDGILDTCISQLLGFSNCLLSTENAQMLQFLNEEFSTQCGSLFCSLVVGHKIAVATEGWWDLDIIDRQLLILFLQTSSSLQNDVVVYLPKKSPNVAYRFVTLSISANSALCVICGAEPTLRSLHEIAENTFRGESNILHSMERLIPGGLPEHIGLDSGIVAIIIANIMTRKCVFSSNIHHSASTTRYLGDFYNMDVLKTFFDDSFSNALYYRSNLTTNNVCELSSQYWSLDTHKCISHFDLNNNIVCLLFISSIPMHTMKYIGEQIFNQIIQDKSLCW
ncbi:protein fuzzy homolog isoform X2 [Lucilia sericata]|uniref:protein fuzzy homolog isoform X2 n=1 Tax=Lucilia sericata TaxID=13632 RepID=UPI0018A85C53|nr:protein fuzzy homolog isoform X2 [Lucilia sericata]